MVKSRSTTARYFNERRCSAAQVLVYATVNKREPWKVLAWGLTMVSVWPSTVHLMEISRRFGQPLTTLTMVPLMSKCLRQECSSELTVANVLLIHPCDAPQPHTVRGQNSNIPEESTYNRYTLHVGAVPNEHHQHITDPQLTDAGEPSTLPSQSLPDGAIHMASAKDIQAPKVGQPNEAVDKHRHQVLGNVCGIQIHGKGSTKWCLVSFIQVDGGIHLLDVGTDARVPYQIRTLSVQTIFQRSQFI